MDDESSTPKPSFLGQSVIPLVNKLQDIFAQLGTSNSIDLPQVGVVGSQSSGKSSVLEALVGRDFLPRGSDICTRRPLVLQLVQTSNKKGAKGAEEEWGEFLHLPGKKITDFKAIRDEIQAETDRETGVNKGISEKQIRLKIFSPYVLNITLVDLPGITKVPVGDQPSDIEARVRTMVLSYIKHDTCIILAVSPANADLANSDALQMARIADPDGSRTIGVITKLDIMDRGTDARNFLLGNVIPLRLGYVGVINRSQEDINSGKSVRDALAYEENFFRARPVYHSLADRCGVQQLAKKLNSILVQHIRALLPELKTRINTQIVTLQKELASYGEMTEKSGMGVLLLSILTKYSQAFATIVDGKNEEMSTSELSGGARIHYIFQSIFVKRLEDVDPCDDLTDDDIRTAIQNATGPKNVLFVPEVPFEVLIRRQIARLLDPSLQCARFVYDELVKISHCCESYDLQRFPVLRRRIEESVGLFLRDGLTPAETMIGHLINMEMDYINTSHPNFIGGSKAVEMALSQSRGGGAHKHVDANDNWRDAPIEKVVEKGVSKRAILSRNAVMQHATEVTSRASAATITTVGAERPLPGAGTAPAASWGITSIFSSGDGGRGGGASGKISGVGGGLSIAGGGVLSAGATSLYPENVAELPVSIHLREPPAILRALEDKSAEEGTEIAVTRLLLKSYYDIVRKNIQDVVPKAIMHFLVNQVKRELHSVFIQELYKESLFEEMLQEKEEVAVKRKRCKDILRVLQQAAWTLEELPLDADVPPRSVTGGLDATGLPAASSYNLASNVLSAGGHFSSGGAHDILPNPYASAAFQHGGGGGSSIGRAIGRRSTAQEFGGMYISPVAAANMANGR
eukprot:TRINITY_DN19108_c0_g1_i1.p1 TRINITY_DN19108_c0_g1~~TRINITY_DN19108_c0_g1_i1.p1  ORF type:complete len:904 (-),score=141.37 TRINITY_DN19108_c0_g1_i1:127-2706(-)